MKSILILLFSVLLFSCSKQAEDNNPRQFSTQVDLPKPKMIKQDSIPPKNKTGDHDPYFNGTNFNTSPNGPKTITRNILQDRKGHYWLATWDGIIRYDGKEFINYTNKENLRRYRAFCMLEDRSGNIWFGTIGAGLYKYDGKSFTNITTEDGILNNSIVSIFEDSKGNIWIGSIMGISIFDGKSFKNFIIQDENNIFDDQSIAKLANKDNLYENSINSIAEDRNGLFWLGTRGEAFTFDGKNFSLVKNSDGSTFSNVRSIISDKDGNIWLGGNNGLWKYNGMTFSNYAKQFVGYIYEDKAGNIWTSAEAGLGPGHWSLSRYSPQSFITTIATPATIKTEENMYFGILEDTQGDIWLGTLRGIYKYDGKTFDNFQ